MNTLNCICIGSMVLGIAASVVSTNRDDGLDRDLRLVLGSHGFTGRIQEAFHQKLGRKVDAKLSDIGRFLWFDTIIGLNDDNTCGGCHSPAAGFGDTQSIAIGIDNNNIVGPDRMGPRNQRRSPMVINAALYPKLMWNGRFAAVSGDPFDNSMGFQFPLPEGFNLSGLPHLLAAQAFIPPTERVETAGFHFVGSGEDIRIEVVRRLNDSPEYRELFGKVYPSVKNGSPITYELFAKAIAEFEFSLVYAEAPIDEFARGRSNAMSSAEKRGALLFFGKAQCVSCHAVAGQSNEMFSDFQNHVLAVPQIVPSNSNMAFDGPGQNEDFGEEQVTGDPSSRYKFRTSPLRNILLQPAFMHNGAFTDLEAAIRHHLDVRGSVRSYSPDGLDRDLRNPIGPMDEAMNRLDPKVVQPIRLSHREVSDLTVFVGRSLLDKNATPKKLRHLVPNALPSGRPPMIFQFPK